MKAYIIRDFKDAGTSKSYTADQVVPDMHAGSFGNYKEAGLVRAATDEEVAAAAAADEAAKADTPAPAPIAPQAAQPTKPAA